MITIKYQTAKDLLQEADILLFRHKRFPSISWFVAAYNKSVYSHSSLVTFIDGEPHLVEFKEFYGGRIVNLENIITANPGRIDVFRVVRKVEIPTTVLDSDGKWKNIQVEDRLGKQQALAITSEAKRLTGQPYDWQTILNISGTYVPLLRLIYNTNNDTSVIDSFVCSTFINYLYRKHYLDLVHFLSDKYTTPGDLGRSSLLYYQFTLV